MKTKLHIVAVLFGLLPGPPTASADPPPIGIAIHGGAGALTRKNMGSIKEKAYRKKLEESLMAGYRILKSGGSSLDAVQRAIVILEDSPYFNAGKGAVFNLEGKNELDASVMSGKTLQAGAVAGIQHIKNPIQLARLVMEKSKHVMLYGKGAEEFAKRFKIPMVPNTYFHTPERWRQHQELKNRTSAGRPYRFVFGTVGAVALDRNGNLAAGTSTGGLTNKEYGRIGDSPIIGAGTYANNQTCAVSATGHGEYFIRWTVAHDISALMEYKGMTLPEATHLVVMEKLKAVGGEGGVIAIDKNAGVSMVFNSEGMFRATVRPDGSPDIKIYRDE